MGTMALGIVFLMTNKPDLLGSVITLVIALIVGVILAQVLVRSGQALAFVQEERRAEEQTTRPSTRV
jgi:tetrahydromethanopterin S-methyltransferase subunit C